MFDFHAIPAPKPLGAGEKKPKRELRALPDPTGIARVKKAKRQQNIKVSSERSNRRDLINDVRGDLLPYFHRKLIQIVLKFLIS
jgi:hypothetical protein